nr:MAG TPA: hypothetical protein [Caudoviricetes sp.]
MYDNAEPSISIILEYLGRVYRLVADRLRKT